jgi:enamine deaminase RidA (YjgF/YER057c/UK114 family)
MTYKAVDAQRPWASLVGYSRAVRVGNIIEVGGTSATLPTGEVHAPGDAYRQTAHILEVVVAALRELGAAPEDVVRTRAYLCDINQWKEVGRAHGELFGHIRPASTFVEVSRLLLPGLVVEIEVTAIIRGEVCQ